MACTDNVMRALFLLALFCVMHGEKEESKRIDAKASGPGGSFDITKLGASGNGKIDNTKAVQEAWASACGDTGKQTILIPKGDFLVGQLNFTGPCKGDVTIHVDGNLLSTMDLSQYKEHGNWIEILRVDNLVITGKGNLDGLGPAVWSKNSCAKKYDCKILPNSLVMDFVNNGEVSGVTLLNSKFFHMKMYQCKDMLIKDVTVTEAVSLLCSAKIPCTGVTMDDINVEYSGTNNKTMAICTNAKGSTKGCLKELACF
ncbi:Pectin lyase-like superfamily protein [Zea mays]|uniref:Pectin lyase-like superfamily protein n=1 Tax=Zea mays TaxID=4577 RepID=A0A1D6LRM4_MAIZE|nr:Pectin lyase-like superfamily protein [Zea mays]